MFDVEYWLQHPAALVVAAACVLVFLIVIGYTLISRRPNEEEQGMAVQVKPVISHAAEKNQTCSWCDVEQLRGSSFCYACGYKLDGTCRNCGLDLIGLVDSGGEKVHVGDVFFCPGCGHAVAHADNELLANL